MYPHSRRIALHKEEFRQKRVLWKPSLIQCDDGHALQRCGRQHDRSNQNQHVERRVDLKAPSHQKTIRVKLSFALILTKQQSRNQETAQHEEKIDSDPACDVPDTKNKFVMAQNEEHSYAP